MSTVRTYNPSVRVGNWNEDICLEEDTMKDFMEKRERGQLLIQKASQMSSNILKKAELSITRDGFVHFGDVVMLMNAGSKDVTGAELRGATTMAVNMSESQMHEAERLEGPCAVSATKRLEPTARNTFVIMPVDDSPPGAPLTHGQHFMICTGPGQGGNLKLHSDIATFTKCSKKSRQQEVCLQEQTCYLSEWKVLSFNPLIRMETEGLPVPANQKLVIVHCKTNQALNVVGDYVLKTPFGSEYEITANTVLDSHRAEKDSNHWIFSSGTAQDPTMPEQILPVGARQ
ncbi:cilia- and flagella-associated protein 161-like [Saccoglossus kowalevskii]|uniref:Uncharacterized protein C15orf26 homolog n=1 Tax=Saccoglossus kowalevskii TaxID=10224 RepID=A0ABM0GNI8_SACKO|nr:PREDICTED: uncharacterized protein C15orf26 homolog [Saccoglossus kowalevskii]